MTIIANPDTKRGPAWVKAPKKPRRARRRRAKQPERTLPDPALVDREGVVSKPEASA